MFHLKKLEILKRCSLNMAPEINKLTFKYRLKCFVTEKPKQTYIGVPTKEHIYVRQVVRRQGV